MQEGDVKRYAKFTILQAIKLQKQTFRLSFEISARRGLNLSFKIKNNFPVRKKEYCEIGCLNKGRHTEQLKERYPADRLLGIRHQNACRTKWQTDVAGYVVATQRSLVMHFIKRCSPVSFRVKRWAKSWAKRGASSLSKLYHDRLPIA